MIGFVIPSVGRKTIVYTLNSLINQTNPNWKCYVGFDNKKETDIDSSILIDDGRIKYFYFGEKLGSEKEHHGNAGLVRNSIIENIDDDIDWIGFVDDDDTLSKYYVEILELEKTKQQFDCCVFRMRYDENNQRIVPPFGMNKIIQNHVGISFCVNREFLDINDILFQNDNAEDFKFLKQIIDKSGKIHISNHITYNVNGHQYYG
jgi:glycosyltransferase involved in cell wall biosynthesis